MAKFNKRESLITTALFQALDAEDAMGNGDGMSASVRTGKAQLQIDWKDKIIIEFKRYKVLFKGFNMARLTILVWITYAFDYWGFSIAGKLFAVYDNFTASFGTDLSRLLPT